MNLILLGGLVLLSPVIYVLLRLLFMVFNYFFHRSQLFSLNPSLPRLVDPMHVLKGWTAPNSTEELMRELNRIGQGHIPPVVFSGPYMAHGRPVLLISDPDLLKEMSDDEEFPKLRNVYDVMACILGDGLVTSSGSKWTRNRTAMNPIFYSNKVRVFSEKMNSVGCDMVKELKERKGEEVDVVELLGRVTQRVLVESLFSSDLDPEKVAKIWKKVNEYFGPYFLGDIILGRFLNQYSPMSNRVSEARAQLRALIQPLINSARSNPNPPDEDHKDFIETLVSLKNEQGELLMNDDHIYEESLVMLFAGHDTTKNTISWSIYFLSRNLDQVQKIRKEIEEELNGHAPTYADIPKLRCCKNAFMEALRLRAPAPQVSRYTPRERTLAGYHIPKNTTLFMNLSGAMMDEKYWKDPFAYRPDRFNEDELYTRMFLPFSLGKRDCIGKRFAMTEGILLIAFLVQNFDFEIMKDKTVTAVFEGTLMPKNFFCKFISVKK